jgi:lipopolysaccharide/colanic/teichoic acid biosynthesis glycosyltransferase
MNSNRTMRIPQVPRGFYKREAKWIEVALVACLVPVLIPSCIHLILVVLHVTIGGPELFGQPRSGFMGESVYLLQTLAIAE